MSAKRRPSPPAKRTPPQATQQGPMLSIGIIFKDDIRCIEHCLQALAPLRAALPCQLVMADTGSSDGSRAVAERYADLLIDFPWVNNFSAARNAVMDRCAGTWFFSIDTDEYLDPDIDRFVQFFTSREHSKYILAYVTLYNYGTQDMVPGDYSIFYGLRLIRMSTGRRYGGAIHEALPKYQDDSEIQLPAIFHHDGYASSIMLSKRKRNMPLLEKELAAAPQDIRRLTQCLESCYTSESAKEYSLAAFEVIDKQPGALNTFGPVALRETLRSAYKYKFPEFEPWYDKALSLAPNSPYVWVDGAYMAALYYMDHNQAEQCLAALARYQSGLSKFLSDGFSWKDLRWSTINAVTDETKLSTLFIQTSACAYLERWEEALQSIEQIHLSDVSQLDQVSVFLSHLLSIWRKGGLDGAQPLLQAAWTALCNDDSKLADERKERFLQRGKALFTLPEAEADELPDRSPSRFFAALGPACALGQAGQALQAQNKDELAALLAGIEDWTHVPPQLLQHAMQLGTTLPEALFQMNSEDVHALTQQLIALDKDGAAQIALDWTNAVDCSTPARLMWLYSLFTAAVVALDWDKNGSIPLCEHYRALTQGYLDTFCPPALLAPEYLQLLTASQRFGWHYLHACACFDNGDLTGYIRCLREGLKTAHAMKKMVQFLSSRPEIQNALNQPTVDPQSEMRQLAQAIQAKVAQLRALGNPLADEIVKSPQYQQLLPLMEKM